MNFRALTEEAYSKYHDLIDSQELKLDEPLLPYEYQSVGGLIIDWQEKDFTRELVNKFNHFVILVFRLRLWHAVISRYSEDEQYELHSEFVGDLLENALGFSYRYKESVAFCAAKICFIDGLHTGKIKKKDVVLDHKINIKTLHALRHAYPACGELINALGLLGDDYYKKSISNFRNRYQHQMEPRLSHGQVSVVAIDLPQDGGVGFTFGVEEPLSTQKCISSLTSQIAPAKSTFHAYRALIDSMTTT